MKLTLGFSPCPNDTFIFDALVNKKIDANGYEFDVVLEDVETLNEWALQGKLDITKLSFPAFFRSLNHYILLDSGSALGKGVGPLLIRKYTQTGKTEKLKMKISEQLSVALPGVNTTAHLLFSFAYPDALNKKFMIFSAIEDAVINGEADLGVIIHENRFTYQQRGLQKVKDLGAYWEEKMQVPIPLGGIAIKKNIESVVSREIEKLIRDSIAYSFKNYPEISTYIKHHSQSLSEQVMRQHIELYVNNYSISLGKEGRNAIGILYKTTLTSSQKKEDLSNHLFL
ncbi:MAG: 1,4-dihydroxy-6-naphthoate synthase [Bacteroidetes bacterium]|nr:1,4-dihydroxy-6-naphthoate synthase [Bacteroidota bacterium]MBS1931459.1 1,4-dihydroxy-6-naphthoate synthase [Bacteroidota bacterium]